MANIHNARFIHNGDNPIIDKNKIRWFSLEMGPHASQIKFVLEGVSDPVYWEFDSGDEGSIVLDSLLYKLSEEIK